MLNLTLDLIWGDGVNLSTNLLEKQSLKGSPIQGRGNRARSVIEERTTTSKSAPIIQREENLALIKPMLNLTACPKQKDEVIYKSEQKNKQKSQPDGAEIKQAATEKWKSDRRICISRKHYNLWICSNPPTIKTLAKIKANADTHTWPNWKME